MQSNVPEKTSRSLARAMRRPALLALSALLLTLGCAAVGDGPSTEGAASVSTSRCAPGRILDARHGTCNGVSGRWW